MNKLFLALSVMAIASTRVFAADVAATAPAVAMAVAPAAVVPVAEKMLGGTVKSVSIADLAKGTKSQIVVAGADAKTTEVLVTGTTTLYGADAKAITFDKIAADAKVEVVYTVSKEGVNEAKSIKIVK